MAGSPGDRTHHLLPSTWYPAYTEQPASLPEDEERAGCCQHRASCRPPPQPGGKAGAHQDGRVGGTGAQRDRLALALPVENHRGEVRGAAPCSSQVTHKSWFPRQDEVTRAPLGSSPEPKADFLKVMATKVKHGSAGLHPGDISQVPWAFAQGPSERFFPDLLAKPAGRLEDTGGART